MSEPETKLQELYEHPAFRAFMRGLRVAIGIGLSELLAYLIEAPEIVQIGIVPFIIAFDKYLRDRKIY